MTYYAAMHVLMGLMYAAGEQRPLYQVLEQQQAQVGGNLMGSDHTYVIPGGKPVPGKKCAFPKFRPLLPPSHMLWQVQAAAEKSAYCSGSRELPYHLQVSGQLNASADSRHSIASCACDRDLQGVSLR